MVYHSYSMFMPISLKMSFPSKRGQKTPLSFFERQGCFGALSCSLHLDVLLHLINRGFFQTGYLGLGNADFLGYLHLRLSFKKAHG